MGSMSYGSRGKGAKYKEREIKGVVGVLSQEGSHCLLKIGASAALLWQHTCNFFPSYSLPLVLWFY